MIEKRRASFICFLCSEACRSNNDWHMGLWRPLIVHPIGTSHQVLYRCSKNLEVEEAPYIIWIVFIASSPFDAFPTLGPLWSPSPSIRICFLWHGFHRSQTPLPSISRLHGNVMALVKPAKREEREKSGSKQEGGILIEIPALVHKFPQVVLERLSKANRIKENATGKGRSKREETRNSTWDFLYYL